MAKASQTENIDPQAVLGDSGRQLALGLVFGVIFGFLLQKGGVAKFEILIGALLLTDFTVIQVMLSAIIVGMAGVLAMERLGWVELKLKPTRYGANTVGGLIFGIGFALAAYCPGTGAAALGQGNFDALAVMAGFVSGSYCYALNSAWLGRTVETWGNRGKIMLDDYVALPQWAFVAIVITALVAVVAGLEYVPDAPGPDR